MQGVACKSSHFESYKPEDDDPLAWEVTFHMHMFVLFHAFLEA